MLPYAEWKMPLRMTFQQGNNPKHTSKAVRYWFRRIDRNNVQNPAEFFNRIKNAQYAIPQAAINRNT